jgi:hypothetical protein
MDFKTSITIPKKELMLWNDRLRSPGDLDYNELDFPKYSTVMKWTATFPNGKEVDLKVNTDTPEDGDVWAEAVLFDENGCQMAYTEPEYDELDGTWYLYDGDDTYTLSVYWGE